MALQTLRNKKGFTGKKLGLSILGGLGALFAVTILFLMLYAHKPRGPSPVGDWKHLSGDTFDSKRGGELVIVGGTNKFKGNWERQNDDVMTGTARAKEGGGFYGRDGVSFAGNRIKYRL